MFEASISFWFFCEHLFLFFNSDINKAKEEPTLVQEKKTKPMQVKATNAYLGCAD
jgi:hypothetical protein